MFYCVPMTTKGKDNDFFYKLSDHYFKRTSRLILSQTKTLDKKRFGKKIGILSKGDFQKVKEKLKTFLL